MEIDKRSEGFLREYSELREKWGRSIESNRDNDDIDIYDLDGNQLIESFRQLKEWEYLCTP